MAKIKLKTQWTKANTPYWREDLGLAVTFIDGNDNYFAVEAFDEVQKDAQIEIKIKGKSLFNGTIEDLEQFFKLKS